MRKKLFWIALVLALVVMASPGPVRSADQQQTTPVQSVPVAPQRVEAAASPAPVTLLAQDARLLLDQLMLRAAEPAEEADAAADGPPRRVIEVEPAGPVINLSDKFMFSALATAGDPPRAEVPMHQRQAIVEQFRQQLKRERERNNP